MQYHEPNRICRVSFNTPVTGVLNETLQIHLARHIASKQAVVESVLTFERSSEQ